VVQLLVVLDRDTADVQVDARIAGINQVTHRHAAAESAIARALQRLHWAVAILVAVSLPLAAAVVRSVAVAVSRRALGRRGGALKGERSSDAEDVPSVAVRHRVVAEVHALNRLLVLTDGHRWADVEVHRLGRVCHVPLQVPGCDRTLLEWAATPGSSITVSETR
jgi:hypothetical protein